MRVLPTVHPAPNHVRHPSGTGYVKRRMSRLKEMCETVLVRPRCDSHRQRGHVTSTNHFMRPFFSVPFVSVVFLLSNSAAAQVDAPDQKAPRVNIVSTNPFGMLFEFYNGEIEHALSSTSSVAVAGSHVGFDDEDAYTTGDVILRYYPSARAVRGFAFGGSVGFARVTNDTNCFDCVNTPPRTHDNAFTVGLRGDYIWILGRDQRFSVATGIGAKRLFYSGSDHSDTEGLPIGRLSIGYAW